MQLSYPVSAHSLCVLGLGCQYPRETHVLNVYTPYALTADFGKSGQNYRIVRRGAAWLPPFRDQRYGTAFFTVGEMQGLFTFGTQQNERRRSYQINGKT